MTTLVNLVVNKTGETRRETLNGREYIVAPLRMIVPGVLDGSKGPLLYGPGEIANNADSWNSIPIVKNHPVKNGKSISARQPKVLEEVGIGFVFNTTVDSGNLDAEGWFDVEKTKEVDERILEKLEANEQIELSTGVFTKQAPVKGKYKNKAYTAKVVEMRPDHLAVLPDKKGACSLEDGCGVLVNEKGETKIDNELSHDDIRTKLSYACRLLLGGTNPTTGEPMEYCWVTEIYPKSFIYEYKNKYYKAGYKIDNKSEEVEVDDGPHDRVVRKTVYELVKNEEPTTNCGGDCDCDPCKANRDKITVKSVVSKPKIKKVSL